MAYRLLRRPPSKSGLIAYRALATDIHLRGTLPLLGLRGDGDRLVGSQYDAARGGMTLTVGVRA